MRVQTTGIRSRRAGTLRAMHSLLCSTRFCNPLCAQIAADATPMSGTNLEPEMINVCFPLSAYRETLVMA
eukprot:COSAG05_NODE_3438_length_2063_cov_2.613035_3_plen_69_part_01